MHSKQRCFREDVDYNYSIFSESVYFILDRIHFELARNMGRISPWKFLFTPSGIYNGEKPKRKHPVIKIMKKERE